MGKEDQSKHYEGDLFNGVGGLVISISHSKESLVLQLARVQQLMKAGQRDYERFLVEEQVHRKVASLHNRKKTLIEGTTYYVAQSKHYVNWATNWSGQLVDYRNEERRLVKAIDALG